jgi:hypothetical protein
LLKRKHKSVFASWDKDSYTERFLTLLPCTCVLQPKLVHLYQTSSLLPGYLPIVASVSLRLLYSLLYSGHINHFQVLGFLHFPYSSCMHSPLSMWPMSNNITAFIYTLHMKENIRFLATWAWLTSQKPLLLQVLYHFPIRCCGDCKIKNMMAYSEMSEVDEQQGVCS